MENNDLNKATDNRKFCSHCRKRINLGEGYFRDAYHGWRQSHVVNLCQRCIVRFIIKIGEENINKMKKEIIVEALDGS